MQAFVDQGAKMKISCSIVRLPRGKGDLSALRREAWVTIADDTGSGS